MASGGFIRSYTLHHIEAKFDQVLALNWDPSLFFNVNTKNILPLQSASENQVWLSHFLASTTTLINFDTIFRKSLRPYWILRLRPKMGGWRLVGSSLAAHSPTICCIMANAHKIYVITIYPWRICIFWSPQFKQYQNELRTIGEWLVHRWFIGWPIIAQQSCQGTSPLYAAVGKKRKNKYCHCWSWTVTSREVRLKISL